jgi:hypothetical protein
MKFIHIPDYTLTGAQDGVSKLRCILLYSFGLRPAYLQADGIRDEEDVSS